MHKYQVEGVDVSLSWHCNLPYISFANYFWRTLLSAKAQVNSTGSLLDSLLH